MLSVLFVAASLGLLVQGAVTPLEPSGGRDFAPGGQCEIQWTPDTTGTWTNTAIELMTGPDDAMVHLHTVYTFDGTNPALTTFTWTCPDVDPHQAIYLYQFTSDATLQDPTEIEWTARFSISNGDVTPAPGGTGTGRLVNLVGAPAPPSSPQYDPNAPPASSSTDAAPTNTGPSNTGTGSANWEDLGGAPATSAGADHAMQGAGQNTRTATAPPITAKPVPNVNDYDSALRQSASVLLAAAVAGGLAILQWL